MRTQTLNTRATKIDRRGHVRWVKDMVKRIHPVLVGSVLCVAATACGPDVPDNGAGGGNPCATSPHWGTVALPQGTFDTNTWTLTNFDYLDAPTDTGGCKVDGAVVETVTGEVPQAEAIALYYTKDPSISALKVADFPGSPDSPRTTRFRINGLIAVAGYWGSQYFHDPLPNGQAYQLEKGLTEACWEDPKHTFQPGTACEAPEKNQSPLTGTTTTTTTTAGPKKSTTSSTINITLPTGTPGGAVAGS